jgi:hypothetical protein
MSKDYFITIDSETTIKNNVADFAAVISDRKGNIHTQCAVLVAGVFTDEENQPLFYDHYAKDETWSRRNLPARYAAYRAMIESGARMIASPAAINRWLDRAANTYNPVLTAYNLTFDLGKCANTGIDLTMFPRSFCMWHAAVNKWGANKKFREFILNTHAFNNPTAYGNMTFKTNAEVMARFILDNPELPNEPHTALEDIIFYELPILNQLVKTTSTKKLIENTKGYNWKDFQVKDWFKAR